MESPLQFFIYDKVICYQNEYRYTMAHTVVLFLENAR